MIDPVRRLESVATPNPLTSIRSRKAFLVIRATVLGVLAWVTFNVTPANAAIIQDTFTAPDDTGLIGRLASPTDTPGNPYSGNGNVSLVGGPTGGTPYEADIQNNAARVGGDAGLGINLGIATATQFQLAITFNINSDTETQANSPFRGAGLGFFSSMTVASGGSSHCFNNFTGLTVDRAGSVRLIVAGANSGTFTIVGGFDPSITHTLSYIVDTTAGVGSISRYSARWQQRFSDRPDQHLYHCANRLRRLLQFIGRDGIGRFPGLLCRGCPGAILRQLGRHGGLFGQRWLGFGTETRHQDPVPSRPLAKRILVGIAFLLSPTSGKG